MLDFFAQLKGVLSAKERRRLVDVLLERVNLSDARRQKLSEFSGGMRQRLGIAQALIGNPQLIIVDEPTAGLDPEERVRFHNLLAETAAEDTVIMLSTHIVSDVSSLCSHMAIIREGEILISTTPAAAIDELDGSIWEATVPHEKVADFENPLPGALFSDGGRFGAFARHLEITVDRAKNSVRQTQCSKTTTSIWLIGRSGVMTYSPRHSSQSSKLK